MNNTTKSYRMKLSTYRIIRKNFKCKYGETTAAYFERLARYLDGKN